MTGRGILADTVTTPILRFLRGAEAAPNAPPALPDLPHLTVLGESGHLHWGGTLDKLSYAMMSLPPTEMAQGLGRLLGVCAALVGGHPAFDPLVALLEQGDKASALFAEINGVYNLRLAVGYDWMDEADARYRPHFTGGPMPPYRNRPGLSLVLAASDATKGAGYRWRRGASNAYQAKGWVLNALESFITLLMGARGDLSSPEALAWAHQLLDPRARQPAPGGMWAEASRSGRTVSVTYGRGAAPILSAAYEVVVAAGMVEAPGYAHRLVKFSAVGRGPPPSDADGTAALADLVRRGVRTVRLSAMRWPRGDDWWARARFVAAGFAAAGPGGDLAIDPGAARALVYAHPKPR